MIPALSQKIGLLHSLSVIILVSFYSLRQLPIRDLHFFFRTLLSRFAVGLLWIMSLKKLNTDCFYGYKVVLGACGSQSHIFQIACFYLLSLGEKAASNYNADFSYASYSLIIVFSSDPLWMKCSGKVTSICQVSSWEHMLCSQQKVLLWEVIP